MKKVSLLFSLFLFFIITFNTTIVYAKPQQRIVSLSQEAIALYDINKKSIQHYDIQIAIPKNTAHKSKMRVLYSLDGNAFVPMILNTLANQHKKNHLKNLPIIVGIGHHSALVYDRDLRTKDYLPKLANHSKQTNTIEDTTQGAATFLHIIQTQIKPLIDKKFNVQTNMLFGHSFGGIFVLYTLFANPQIFDYYFVASPSLWQKESNIILSHLAKNTHDPKVSKSVIITKGQLESNAKIKTTPNTLPISNIDTLMDHIKISFPNVHIEFIEFAGQNHGSSIPHAMQSALNILSQ